MEKSYKSRRKPENQRFKAENEQQKIGREGSKILFIMQRNRNDRISWLKAKTMCKKNKNETRLRSACDVRTEMCKAKLSTGSNLRVGKGRWDSCCEGFIEGEQSFLSVELLLGGERSGMNF